MRTAKPRYRSRTDAWYVCLHGKQILLAKGKRNKSAANRAFKRLEARQTLSPPNTTEAPMLSVVGVMDSFLEHIKDRRSYAWYQQLLQDFTDTHGNLLVSALTQEDVTKWLEQKKTWGPTTKNKVIGILNQAFTWAVRQGQMTRNPAAAIKKPRANRRDRILTASERQSIWNAARGIPFKNLVTALQETGARPGEIAKVTAADLDLKNGVWVLTEHKTAHATPRPVSSI
jgi:integrase